MIFLLFSVAFTGIFCFAFCLLLIKYFKLSGDLNDLKNYIKKTSHIVSSARYGNLYSRIIEDDKTSFVTLELSKNLNNLLESIIDRDIMINEYIENEKEETTLKEDFIASLTHDLKVPIIAQDNTYELLLSEKFGPLTDIQKEALVKLKISNIDLKYLIEALLETYKVEHKGISIKKEEGVLINKFIKETMNQLSSIFELHNKNIVFETKLKDDFSADIDTFLVKRVVNNLILNALSYSANSDKIEVRLEEAAFDAENKTDGFKISVRDFGIGIEKEEIDKIFNKYYCGKLNLTRSSTGLGLYLSNKIIKALGGKIEVQSKKNEGSTFTVILPLE